MKLEIFVKINDNFASNNRVEIFEDVSRRMF